MAEPPNKGDHSGFFRTHATGTTPAQGSPRLGQPHYAGDVRRAGDLYVELVATQQQLKIYPRNRQGQDLDSSQARAEALICGEHGNRRVTLAAGQDAPLAGVVDLPEQSRVRVILTLQLPGRNTRHLVFGPVRIAPKAGANRSLEKPRK